MSKTKTQEKPVDPSPYTLVLKLFGGEPQTVTGESALECVQKIDWSVKGFAKGTLVCHRIANKETGETRTHELMMIPFKLKRLSLNREIEKIVLAKGIETFLK